MMLLEIYENIHAVYSSFMSFSKNYRLSLGCMAEDI